MTFDEERQRYFASCLKTIDALRTFFDTPVRGLWFDKWPSDRTILNELAPASTFYHIVCAIYETEAVLTG